ncbi:class I SAM-dependent methyltransferase [Delftia sp. PS-11]|uniref:class I SAM-dependent methyltransferase n=1 Tax=Delftia sp. PS-11 TaxID=2767222 RepID=UPI002453DF14|nr:class I SAM-dependent methyltransferase [Delftia sp. PS-11]KAJ8745200.1 class I SAM-dependent methyltransferase [Delftia sp. PS-11]
MHADTPASPWIQRWSHLVPAHATVLDVACGQGRHMRWFHARGHAVTGVDRDRLALDGLQGLGERLCADIENDPWPLQGRQFGAVVVTHYLWRPLWPRILDSVAPGGLLLYETFAQGNEAFGKPSRPDFLLAPGELLQVCAGWRIVAYEHGLLRGPERMVQRIAALRPDGSAREPMAQLAYPMD